MAKTRPKQQQGLRPWAPGQSGNPAGRPPDIVGRALKQLTRQDLTELANVILAGSMEDLREVARSPKTPVLKALIAQSCLGAYSRKEFTTVDRILNRLVGTAKDDPMFGIDQGPRNVVQELIDFEKFCENATYAKPFQKQVEMMTFAIDGEGPRLLLGARKYGKTDYVTILGIAYDVYKKGTDISWLIITKSKVRNTALMEEIANALKANGVRLSKANASCIRVAGRVGKDHSVAAITLRASFRGRHPDRIAMDDPVDETDVSAATRKLAERKYDEAYKLCKNMIIIGQPVHQADLYAKLRNILKKMEVAYGSIPQLDEDLTAARAAGVSEESIQRSYFLKSIADTPMPLAGIKFAPKYPVGPSVAFIDPSFEGGDFTAISIGRLVMDSFFVQGNVWKKAWHHCFEDIEKLCATFGVQRICFETNALGEDPVVQMRAKIKGVGVTGRKSTGHKHSRILAISPFAAHIFISRTSDKQYIDQVVNYELGAEFDDAPDSLASLLGWIGYIKGR